MLVYVVALIEALVYLLAIPVNLALRLDGARVRSGVSVFDRRRARRRARAGGEAGGKPGFRAVWPVLRRLRFERVELTGRVSLGDAAATAMLCGGINALGRGLRGRTERMRVDVRPVFSDDMIFELRGMLCARTGQIMLAAFHEMRGRIHPWTSIRLRAS